MRVLARLLEYWVFTSEWQCGLLRQAARRIRNRSGFRVLSQTIVTGRGRSLGGADLNENTTRLVVCIPVLASPSCCNPIFTYARIYFPLGWIRNCGSASRSDTGDGEPRVCRCEPCTRRIPAGHYSVLGLFLLPSRGYRVACREALTLRAMSIDTLLEAARYLEWQAQQQQITRGK